MFKKLQKKHIVIILIITAIGLYFGFNKVKDDSYKRGVEAGGGAVIQYVAKSVKEEGQLRLRVADKEGNPKLIILKIAEIKDAE